MRQTNIKAVSEGSGPVSQDKAEFGELTMAEIHQVFAEELDKHFDRITSPFDQRFGESKQNNKNSWRLAGLQHEPQQSRLAGIADVKLDMKTRERMESTAAENDKYGDISSARVDDDPTSLTSFRNLAKPLAST